MITRVVANKLMKLMTQKMYASRDNHFKQILRELLNVFGNLYYYDGKGDPIKIKCSTGKPERLRGKDLKDNTLILPFISISERGASNDDSRRRYVPLLVNEVVWDKDELRAKRYLSLAPRPINAKYDINIWTKYSEDMDMIRECIFHLFNPDLEITTKDNDYIKAFIETEGSITEHEQPDTRDRIIQKRITISVETYLKSPRILYTNTDQINDYIFEVDIVRGG